MERIERFAKLGDFIPHGDDSFIDDQGITNRWAEGRRLRRQAALHQDAVAREEDRLHWQERNVMFQQAIEAARAVGAGINPNPALPAVDQMTEEEIDRELNEIIQELETIDNEHNP